MSSQAQLDVFFNFVTQRWKPVGCRVAGRIEILRPAGQAGRKTGQILLSGYYSKRHLSINRNILIYFTINKTFYKKTVLTNYIFRKHLLNGFKL